MLHTSDSISNLLCLALRVWLCENKSEFLTVIIYASSDIKFPMANVLVNQRPQSNHSLLLLLLLFFFLQLIVSSIKNKTLFISSDEGKTYERDLTLFSPYTVSCNPGKDSETLVAYDLSTSKVSWLKMILYPKDLDLKSPNFS